MVSQHSSFATAMALVSGPSRAQLSFSAVPKIRDRACTYLVRSMQETPRSAVSKPFTLDACLGCKLGVRAHGFGYTSHQGWPEKALQFSVSAVRACRRLFGVHHLDTVAKLRTLKRAYRESGKLEQALRASTELVDALVAEGRNSVSIMSITE